MIFKKIYDKYRSMSDYVLFSAPSVVFEDDIIFYIYKVTKINDMERLTMDKIPEDIRKYPTLVAMYMLAFIKDNERRRTKEFAISNMMLKSFYKKHHNIIEDNNPVLTFNALFDAQIDEFKRIKLNFIRPSVRRRKYFKKRVTKKTLKKNYFEERNFFKNYVEFYTKINKNFTFEKIFEKSLLSPEQARWVDKSLKKNKYKYNFQRHFKLLVKKLYLLKLKKRRYALKKYIGIKRFYQCLYRMMLCGKYNKDISKMDSSLSGIVLRAKNVFDLEVLDVETSIRQMENKRFEDAYLFKLLKQEDNIDNLFDKILHLPTKFIRFHGRKLNLMNYLRGLTNSNIKINNINNINNICLLDLNILYNFLTSESLIHSSTKDLNKLFPYYINKTIIEISSSTDNRIKGFINDYLKLSRVKDIYTYEIPMKYNLKDLIDLSVQEKLSLLKQIRYFKFSRMYYINRNINSSYYFSSENPYKSFAKDKFCISLNNYAKTHNTTSSFIIKLIKYVSLLNSIVLSKFKIKIFYERILFFKELVKFRFVIFIDKFLKENFNKDAEYVFMKLAFLEDVKIYILFYIYSLKNYIKIMLYKIYKCIYISFFFIIKSFVYLLILFLQFFFPFSYIIIAFFEYIFLNIVKYIFKIARNFNFKKAFVKYLRSFKNQLESNRVFFKSFNFKSYKQFYKDSVILKNKKGFTFINDFFNIKEDILPIIFNKNIDINPKDIKTSKIFKDNLKGYGLSLNNATSISLGDDSVQVFLKRSCTKIYLGELYLPNQFPCLEAIKRRFNYEELNYMEKLFYKLSRTWIYKSIFEYLNLPQNSDTIKLLNFFLIKINKLFFINRVEFLKDGIDFYDYYLTNDSVYALQEYLILTKNYKNAKKNFKLYVSTLKLALNSKEAFIDFVEWMKKFYYCIKFFLSNSAYRNFIRGVIYNFIYKFYYIFELIVWVFNRIIDYLIDFINFHVFGFKWVNSLYKEMRFLLYIAVQGYYTSPSRPFFSFTNIANSSFFGIRTYFEVYADVVEAIIYTYVIKISLAYDKFYERNEPIISEFFYVFNFIRRYIWNDLLYTLIFFISSYFIFDFIYNRILYYFFYIPLYQRIRVEKNYHFICNSQDPKAIEFAKYVKFHHERIITFRRWLTWVHFDKPKIYYRKFMLIFLNLILIVIRKFIFPEIYGFTLVILDRINRFSKVITYISNFLIKLDDWAWILFDFINQILYVKLPFNVVYHWQCYTIEYRGLIKLFFYTPIYLVIILLQIIFIIINIIILLLPSIIVLLDTLVEMYHNYLTELLKISPFASHKEHYDKYYMPRFDNIYRSHRNRLSESLTFKNDMLFFGNHRKKDVKKSWRYFIDFYSKKRDLVYRCKPRLGYKRDKQIMRINYLRDTLKLRKSFIGDRSKFVISKEWFSKKYYDRQYYEHHKHVQLYPNTKFHPNLLGQYGSKVNFYNASTPLELPNRFSHYYLITNNTPKSLYNIVPNYWFDREIDDMIDDDFESSSLDLFDTMEPNEERYIALKYKRDICAAGYYDSMEMEEQTFWSEYTFITLYRSIHNFLIKKETESIKDLLPTDRIFDFYYNESNDSYYDTYGNEVMIENFELKYHISDYFDWRFPDDLLDVAYGVVYDYNEENRYFDIKWNKLKLKINTIYSYANDINKKLLYVDNKLDFLELKKIPDYDDPEIMKEFDSLRTQFNYQLNQEYIRQIKLKRTASIRRKKEELISKRRLEILEIFEKKKEEMTKEINSVKYVKPEEIERRNLKLRDDLNQALLDIKDDPLLLEYENEEKVEIAKVMANLDYEIKCEAEGLNFRPDEHKRYLLAVRSNLRIDLKQKIKRIISKITELQSDYLRLIEIKQKNNFLTTESAIKKIYKEEEDLRRKHFIQCYKKKQQFTFKEMRPLTEESISFIKSFVANMFKLQFNQNISELRTHLNMAKFQLRSLECDILFDKLAYRYEDVMKDLMNLRFIKKNNLFKSKEQEKHAELLVINLNKKIKKDKIRLARKINSIKKIRTEKFLYKDYNLWFSGFSYYHSIYVSCLDNGVFTWPYGHIQAGMLEDWGNWYFKYAFSLGYESFVMPDGEYYEHEEDEDEEDEDNEETEDFDDETDGDSDPWYIDGWDMDEQIDTEDILGWLHQYIYEDDVEKGGFKIRDNNKKFFYKETNKLYLMEFVQNLRKAAKSLREDSNRTFEELNFYERLIIKENLVDKEDGLLKLAKLMKKKKKEISVEEAKLRDIEIKRYYDMAAKYASARRTRMFRILNKLYRKAIFKIDDFRRADKVYIPKGYWDREKDKEKYKEFARNRKLQLDMAYKKGEIMMHRLSFIQFKNLSFLRPNRHYFADLYYNEYYLLYRIYRRKRFTYVESFSMKPFIRLIKILLKKYPNDKEQIYEDMFKLFEKICELKIRARKHNRFFYTKAEKSMDKIFILDPEEVKAEAEYVKNRDEGNYLF